MAIIRVLVVDDSPTLRYLIRCILNSDPELEVVGEACDGRQAIAACEQLQPDIITMDIQMPGADGLQAIRHIMAESPRPIVVLTSSTSDQESQITYKGIEAGALMVIGKPHGLPGEDPEADRLIAQVKAMAGVKVVRRSRRLYATALGPPVTPSPSLLPARPVRLIAIGASTGGPPALQVILAQLEASLPVPMAVVQHISTGFVQGLARWLDETTPLRVKVAESGETLAPGTVYLAPDGQHLQVARKGTAQLSALPKVDGHCPSITALFEAVAHSYGREAVGVLLTGMGSDGARGLKLLRDAGGHTIAQDEATCVIFGMPKEAIALDAAVEVLALNQIGGRLAKLAAAQSRQVH